MTIPSDEPETQDIGVDLDGDGEVDNKLGKLVNAFYAYSPADINDKIAVGEFVLMLLDNECSQGMSGCQDVVNGEGDCVAWDGDPETPPLSLDELLCNAFFMSQLSPDVDWDGDGEPELLSAGLKTSVVPITIDN